MDANEAMDHIIKVLRAFEYDDDDRLIAIVDIARRYRQGVRQV